MSLSTNNQASQATDRARLLRVLSTVTVSVGLLFACVQGNMPQTGPVARSYAAPGLGVVIDEAMKVVDVDSTSVADQAGIQKGDVLISIEDIPFATEKQKAKELIWAAADEEVFEHYNTTGEWNGKTFHLRFERNGEIMEVEVTPISPPTWMKNLDPKPTPGYAPFDYF